MTFEKKRTRDSQEKIIRGVQIGTAYAGIKNNLKNDLTLFLFDNDVTIAAIFTKNQFFAAPIEICRQNIDAGAKCRAILINTGNANAGTGTDGISAGLRCCDELSRLLNFNSAEIWPFSTGVIMEPLPVDKILRALPALKKDAEITVGLQGWLRAAEAIMTTDTFPKMKCATGQINSVEIVATGVAKGAGMIRPNMATMLSFVATDAAVSESALKEIIKELSDQSFNRITVDGDTSTNDSFVLVATGKAGNTEITSSFSADGLALKEILLPVVIDLAQSIVRDGEGATKFITVQVSGGENSDECKKVAYSIANSPLVKTAFFASDPNLGRILAAIGYSGIENFDIKKVEMYLDDVHVFTKGARNQSYSETDGKRVMNKQDVLILVELGRGFASEHIWTCDLSDKYIEINANYRS